jgi:hypothetical protein
MALAAQPEQADLTAGLKGAQMTALSGCQEMEEVQVALVLLMV